MNDSLKNAIKSIAVITGIPIYTEGDVYNAHVPDALLGTHCIGRFALTETSGDKIILGPVLIKKLSVSEMAGIARAKSLTYEDTIRAWEYITNTEPVKKEKIDEAIALINTFTGETARVNDIESIIDAKEINPIDKAINLISQNFAANITIKTAASHVGLSRTYFSTLFKKTVGQSFTDYLNEVRVKESKRLLINTDFPIVEIALATGFTDQSFFSKVFKKTEGITPKQYREAGALRKNI